MIVGFVSLLEFSHPSTLRCVDSQERGWAQARGQVTVAAGA